MLSAEAPFTAAGLGLQNEVGSGYKAVTAFVIVVLAVGGLYIAPSGGDCRSDHGAHPDDGHRASR